VNALFKKLNFKNQHAIFVLNAPAPFRAAMDDMRGATEVRETLAKAQAVGFALAFVTRQSDVDRFADAVARASESDPVVWVAYSKSTSKNYTCEINRDHGWARFGEHGLEPVRQVAIDDDWSALRFRRVEHIKTMTRGFAMSAAGRAKVRAEKTRTPVKWKS